MSVARASRIESGAGDAEGVGGRGRPEARAEGSICAAAGGISPAGLAEIEDVVISATGSKEVHGQGSDKIENTRIDRSADRVPSREERSVASGGEESEQNFAQFSKRMGQHS